jgi:hypothetical protein
VWNSWSPSSIHEFNPASASGPYRPFSNGQEGAELPLTAKIREGSPAQDPGEKAFLAQQRLKHYAGTPI